MRSVNPHLDFVNSSTHGFDVLEITPQRIRCRMTAISGVRLRWAFTWLLQTREVVHPSA